MDYGTFENVLYRWGGKSGERYFVAPGPLSLNTFYWTIQLNSLVAPKVVNIVYQKCEPSPDHGFSFHLCLAPLLGTSELLEVVPVTQHPRSLHNRTSG